MLTLLATADMPRNGDWKRWMRTEEGRTTKYPDVKWMRNKQAAYVRLRKRGQSHKQNVFRTVKSDSDEKFEEKLDAAAKILQKIFDDEDAGELPESGPDDRSICSYNAPADQTKTKTKRISTCRCIYASAMLTRHGT